MKTTIYLCGLGCALVACGCRTVTHDASGRQTRSLPVLSVPRAAASPVIDGALDDAVWACAATIRGLGPSRGGDADRGRIALLPTTIRVAWDTNALYIAFECLDKRIDVNPAARYDGDLYLNDVCEVFLDPVGDGRQYMEIQVDPDGQTLDMVHLLTAPPEYTPTGRLTPAFSQRERWSFREWEATGLRTGSGRLRLDGAAVGWTVELAIPAAPIMKRRGVSTFMPGEIRANFTRHDWTVDPGTGMRALLPMYWSPVEHGCPHISAGLMGRLALEP